MSFYIRQHSSTEVGAACVCTCYCVSPCLCVLPMHICSVFVFLVRVTVSLFRQMRTDSLSSYMRPLEAFLIFTQICILQKQSLKEIKFTGNDKSMNNICTYVPISGTPTNCS